MKLSLAENYFKDSLWLTGFWYYIWVAYFYYRADISIRNNPPSLAVGQEWECGFVDKKHFETTLPWVLARLPGMEGQLETSWNGGIKA